jgi:CRISPR-associated protein Csy2
MKQYIVVRQLHVRAANAISSSITYGFPAVTAFTGFAHALQRHFNLAAGNNNFHVEGVGIVSHQFEMLDYQSGYNRYFQLTANPLNAKGERPSFVEEGRCHMTVSLILEVTGLHDGSGDLQKIADIIFSKMKLAGGDLLSPPIVEFLEDEPKSLRRLMPGYVLMERRDLMVASMNEGQDALQALHSHLSIQYRSITEEDGQVNWYASRQNPGWIIPIAVGFHAISPPGAASQSRDNSTPHRFAETIVTLGEFVLVSRIESLKDIMWRYRYGNDIYACVQESQFHASNKI